MANNYLSFNRSLLAMAALQALPLSLFAQNTGEKPNILYIMCDDHAIQAISANWRLPQISTDLQKGE